MTRSRRPVRFTGAASEAGVASRQLLVGFLPGQIWVKLPPATASPPRRSLTALLPRRVVARNQMGFALQRARFFFACFETKENLAGAFFKLSPRPAGVQRKPDDET